jgi:hypothetical protein
MPNVCFKSITSNPYAVDVLPGCTTSSTVNFVFTKPHVHLQQKRFLLQGLSSGSTITVPAMDRFSCVCLSSAFTLVSCSANSWTLKMEEIYSFETSFDFQRTTPRYISEDVTLLLNSLWTTWVYKRLHRGRFVKFSYRQHQDCFHTN